MSATAAGSTAVLSPSSVIRPGLSAADLNRRAHGRLAERFEPAKVRHKPLSILRQEGRRALDQFLDAESPGLSKTEKERVIEEVLSEAVTFGPLEELFRDLNFVELMVLTPTQVIARKGDNWLPTSIRFRDAEHLRAYLKRLLDGGEAIGGESELTGAFDVRLANSFRAIGFFPPAVMNLPPQAVFARVTLYPPPAEPPATVSVQTLRQNTTGPANPSGVVRQPMAGGASGVMRSPLSPSSSVVMRSPLSGPSGTVKASGMTRTPEPPTPLPPPPAPAADDPFAKVRQRVTERLISMCAAAGMYDLSIVPTSELQQILFSQVIEIDQNDRLGLSESQRQRLVLEILAGMNR